MMDNRAKDIGEAKWHRGMTWVVLAVLFVVSIDCAPLWACPTCKDAMVHSNQQGIQLGYYWSILFMMSMPFAIFGGWMFYVWRVCRNRSTDGLGSGELVPATASIR